MPPRVLPGGTSPANNDMVVMRQLFGLGQTEAAAALLDVEACEACCDAAESAATASSRRLRAVPRLQRVGLFLAAPPYARVVALEAAARAIEGIEEVRVARVGLEVEDLLYGDLSLEFRAAAVEDGRGGVRRFSAAVAASVERLFGRWAVAEVVVGGRLAYRKLAARPEDAGGGDSVVSRLLASLFGGEGEASSRLLATRDGRWRVSVAEAKPGFDNERFACFEDAVEAWRARAAKRPVAVAVSRKTPVLRLLRQAYASLLRLLTLQRARELWAAKLKAIVDSAVESSKRADAVVDRAAVAVDAGLAEDALASVFHCRDQRHLDEVLGRFDPAADHRAVLVDNLRRLDARLATLPRELGGDDDDGFLLEEED